MTTAIRDAAGKGRSWIIRDADTHVSITGSTSDGTIDRASLVDRAEFLAAVADELDVIVTPKADLPQIEDDGSGDLRVIPGDRPASVLPSTPGATEYRRRALVSLALAEHLENAVDEAQVNALARLVAAETNGTHIPATALARRLIQAGVRMDGAK